MVEQLQKNLEKDFNIRTLNAWFVDSFGRAASRKLVAKRLEPNQAAITAYILRAVSNLPLRLVINRMAVQIRDADVRKALELPPKSNVGYEHIRRALPLLSPKYTENRPFEYLTEILVREGLAPQIPPNSVKSSL